MKEFLKDFFNRDGIQLLLGELYEKVANLLLNIIAAHFILKDAFGPISYWYAFVSFIIPLSDLGMNQIILRFYSQTENKKAFLNKVFFKGLKAVLLIGGFFAFFVAFQNDKDPWSGWIFAVFIVSFYLTNLIKNYFKVLFQNKRVAWIVFWNSTLMLCIALLSYYHPVFYPIALAFPPLLLFFVFKKDIVLQKRSFQLPKDQGKYGLRLSVVVLISQLLIVIDIVSISWILTDRSVSDYKIASLLPLALMFLGRVILNIDFPKLVLERRNKVYLKTYVYQYLKIISILVLGLMVFYHFFFESLFKIFGAQYQWDDLAMTVHYLMGMLLAALFLRIPFANLLSVLGADKLLLNIAIFVLSLNIIGNIYVLPKMGIEGAAMMSMVSMLVYGISCTIAFYFKWKKL